MHYRHGDGAHAAYDSDRSRGFHDRDDSRYGRYDSYRADPYKERRAPPQPPRGRRSPVDRAPSGPKAFERGRRDSRDYHDEEDFYRSTRSHSYSSSRPPSPAWRSDRRPSRRRSDKFESRPGLPPYQNPVWVFENNRASKQNQQVDVDSDKSANGSPNTGVDVHVDARDAAPPPATANDSTGSGIPNQQSNANQPGAVAGTGSRANSESTAMDIDSPLTSSFHSPKAPLAISTSCSNLLNARPRLPPSTEVPTPTSAKSLAPVTRMMPMRSDGARSEPLQINVDSAPAKSKSRPASPTGPPKAPPAFSIPGKNNQSPLSLDPPPKESPTAPRSDSLSLLQDFVALIVNRVQQVQHVEQLKSRVSRRARESAVVNGGDGPDEVLKRAKDELEAANQDLRKSESIESKHLSKMLSSSLFAAQPAKVEESKETQTLKEKIAELETANEELRAQFKDVQSDCKQIKVDVNQAKSVKSTVKDLESNVHEAFRRIDRTEDKIKNIRNEKAGPSLQEFSNATDGIGKTRSSVSELSKTVSGLKEEIKNNRSLTDRLRDEVNPLHDDVVDLKAARSQIPKPLKQWQQDVSDALSVHAQKLADLETLPKQAESAAMPLSELRNQIGSLQDEVRGMKSAQSSAETQRGPIEERLERIDQHVRDAKAKTDPLPARIANLEIHLDDRLRAVFTLQEYMTNLSNRLDSIERKQEENACDNNQIWTTFSADVSKTKADVAATKINLSECQRTIEEIKSKLTGTATTPASLPNSGSGRASPAMHASTIPAPMGSPSLPQQRNGWRPAGSGNTQLQQLDQKLSSVCELAQRHESLFQSLTTKHIYDSMVYALKQMYPTADGTVRAIQANSADLATHSAQIKSIWTRLEELASRRPDSTSAETSKMISDLQRQVVILNARGSPTASDTFSSGVSSLEEKYKRDFASLGKNMVYARNDVNQKLEALGSRLETIEKDTTARVDSVDARYKQLRSRLGAVDERHGNSTRHLHETLESVQSEAKDTRGIVDRDHENVNTMSQQVDAMLESWGPEIDQMGKDIKGLKSLGDTPPIKNNYESYSKNSSRQPSHGPGIKESIVLDSKKNKTKHKRKYTNFEDEDCYPPKRSAR